jgi:hypothetical protein
MRRTRRCWPKWRGGHDDAPGPGRCGACRDAGCRPRAGAGCRRHPWRLVPPGETRTVAKSSLAVTAAGTWNRSTRRPTSRSEVWTRHGLGLGEIDFFVIPRGKPLFRERDKKKAPLPRFDPAMLPPDLVEWFRNTARIVTGGSLFETFDVRPATLAGYPGVAFGYSYTTVDDNLERLGLARAAVIGGTLYLITFDAPKLHYFDASVADVRATMDSARFTAAR